MVQLPNGATVFIASGYAAVRPITALSNFNPAEARLAPGHGVANGDFVEIVSGWSKLDGKVVRATGVGSSPSDSIDLEGIDTSSTSLYPAGSGTGSLREISGWTQVQQILTASSEGGEQQFLTYQFLEDDAEKRIPTKKTAVGVTFSIADDTSLPGYAVLKAANDDRVPRACKIVLPDGKLLLWAAYLSVGDIPSMTIDEIMALQVTMSLVGGVTRYAA
jgi:hypothetical protein